MNIIFKSIKLSNFMSFDYAEMSLGNQGFVSIQGINKSTSDNALSNGAGKTSCFEAIIWCLCGETLRKSKQITNINGNDGAYVEVEFSVNNIDYKVIRTKDHSKFKTNLKLYVNGEDKSGKGIRDTELILKEYLPDLSSQLLGSVVILGQGLPMRFTNNTPSGRKDVLEKLSQSEYMIEELKDKLTNRKKTLEKKLNEYNIKLAKCQTEKTLVEKIIFDTEKELEDLVFPDEHQITQIDDEIEVLDKTKKEAALQKELQEEYLSELVNKSHVYYEQKLEDFNNIFDGKDLYTRKCVLEQQINSYKKEIAAKKSITDICPTCGQKLTSVVIPDTSHEEYLCECAITEYEEVSKNYQSVVMQANSLKNQLTEKYNKLLTENEQESRATKDRIINFEKQIRKIEFDINTLQTSKAAILQNMDNYLIRKQNIENKLSYNKNRIITLSSDELYNNNEIDLITKQLSIDSKIDTLLKRDFRSYLLTNVVNFINKKVKYYCSYFVEHGKVEFKQDGNAIDILFNDKEYESLSGGEKQKIDIIIQLALRDMMSTFLNFSSNVIVLDEITDFLDTYSADKLVNVISNLLSDVSSIFFISHHKELNLPYDKVITVVKDTDGMSRLS